MELATLLAPVQSEWLLLRPQLLSLTKAAVEARYPGLISTKRQAREALMIAHDVRDRARVLLKLAAMKPKPKGRRGTGGKRP